MRLQKKTIGEKVKITFIPETEKERSVCGYNRASLWTTKEHSGVARLINMAKEN